MYEIPLSCTYALSLTEQNAHFLLFLSLCFILNPVQMDPFSFWCICINFKLNNWSVLRLTVLTIVARGYVSSALVISEAVRPALLNGICCKPFSASCLAGVSLIWALWALWKLENCAQNLTNWVRWEVKFPVQLALPFSLGICVRVSEDGLPLTDVLRLCVRTTALPAGRAHSGVQVLQWRNYRCCAIQLMC